jgi:hypothetical protein
MWWDDDIHECQACEITSDYFFECAACDGTDDITGLSSCTVCIDNYAVTYDKTTYNLSDPEDIGSLEVTECLGVCPPYYSPSWSVKDDSDHHLETSECEY